MYQSKKPYLYGTGRRKSSVARVHLFQNGTGAITINGRDIDEYFGLETLKMVVRQPLTATEELGKVDIVATVEGGGVSGQPRVPHRPEEGRLPHARSSYEGAQEIRSQSSSSRASVLQALKKFYFPRKTSVFRGFSLPIVRILKSVGSDFRGNRPQYVVVWKKLTTIFEVGKVV